MLRNVNNLFKINSGKEIKIQAKLNASPYFMGMNNDTITIIKGTPEYNQYLMGIAGGLTRYGAAPVNNVDIAEFKTDLEKRFMMITEVECDENGKYILRRLQ